MEMEDPKTVSKQIGIPNAHPTALRSRFTNPVAEPASRGTITSRQRASSTNVESDRKERRPSSSGGVKSTASRSATPTGRPNLPATLKPSRASTPTSRATVLSSKPTDAPGRSSTPTRATRRSSTPTARPSMPVASKSTSRSATPTSRPSTLSSVPSMLAPPVLSSSVTKASTTTLKNPVPSRGTSPTVKSRPWKSPEMPGFSEDAPPNLKTSMPERPASASRGRAGASNAQSSSTGTFANGRNRRQSCSPSRGQVVNGRAHKTGSSVLARSRGHSNSGDDVNPVLIGTKMVERVVNMRKLAPPKQDGPLDNHKNPVGKSSSSQENLGFGRTLSKTSLDMAIRHMDIRRSISGNLRPLVTKIPASSVYSVGSGTAKSRTASLSDSPLATSSYTSSDPSVNNNSHGLDGSEMEDDLSSEKGPSSPMSQKDQ
ncbi:unnamed protein product [Ilex paraguariensis]|uniref:Uncharacterized protein n=1 Tax=Ilex paraguariensis TaxID=185542 RepID=A0ABC8QMH3_9AQUA